ncbi:hypothetical protein A2368_04580 [Candidatus Collierbacteria bacterium RIFOXYB1_FULL_49_13]|uniref:Uncharacterized protein n=1 Tax=Candidatus Collierbacteria bacterium RIFOXYB1_FULL_49_13 TaxID=1817728 RepID=A0A1F5FF52_9BACT|nr:MAG: hypothetical protein A2368_04580 [Candidatus Collierbacteria bacterium RIFOXYB1_FULL_49_13]
MAFNRRIARLAELSLFVFIVGFFMAVLADDGREVTFYSYEEIAIWTEIIVFVVLPILDKTLAPKDDRPRRKKKHEDVWIDYEPEDEGDALIGIDADGQMILTREQ